MEDQNEDYKNGKMDMSSNPMSKPKPHILSTLPDELQRMIMEKFSPFDHLNLTKVDSSTCDFVYNFPKKFKYCRIMYEPYVYLIIVGWNNDPSQPTYKIIHNPHKKSHESSKTTRKNGMIVLEHFYDRDLSSEELIGLNEQQMGILLNNSKVDRLYPTPTLLLNDTTLQQIHVKTKTIICDGLSSLVIFWKVVGGRRWKKELVRVWQLLNVREVCFWDKDLPFGPLSCVDYEDYKEIDKYWNEFLTHKIIRNLECLHIVLPPCFIRHVLKLTSPRMDIIINDVTCDEFKLLMDVVIQVIQQWQDGRRNINTLKFHVSHSRSHFSESFEEFEKLENRFAENGIDFHGGFEDSTIKDGYKLIKKNDALLGRGLFVFYVVDHIFIIECDYNLRRRIGLAENFEVNDDVDAQVLQREKNINQLFHNRSEFLQDLFTKMNRNWPDSSYDPSDDDLTL